VIAEAAATQDSTQIIVAVITAGGLLIGGVLALIVSSQRGRRENREQHADNRDTITSALGELVGKVDIVHGDVLNVGRRLDDHMRDHAPTTHAPDAEIIVMPQHRTSGNSPDAA